MHTFRQRRNVFFGLTTRRDRHETIFGSTIESNSAARAANNAQLRFKIASAAFLRECALSG
ncbi:MAG TPA: hypothetical protein PKD09_05265 [Aggregatilinea sp.]|uniref:hypothetical protein n=1 Tax=Aggregatilinea sp. TaxID=2806333 RepID=UPI002CF6F07E|nr:hypothetical protein [Aggregatilinea sp.]HML21035.1 hypothetical protein [Aggregatilinea sp.]